jgi:hypothetical protein
MVYSSTDSAVTGLIVLYVGRESLQSTGLVQRGEHEVLEKVQVVHTLKQTLACPT